MKQDDRQNEQVLKCGELVDEDMSLVLEYLIRGCGSQGGFILDFNGMSKGSV